jgi:formylglycine-generating enzyme required for sulfatase activity
MRGLLIALIAYAVAASAQAQPTPEQQAQIAAYAQQSNALLEAYRTEQAALAARRANADPFADIRARSARLTPAQRAEAQAIFGSAFQIWQAGDMAAAALAFERGLAIDPANGPANFYMGDVFGRRGDTERAREHYRRAVAFGANTPEAFRAETALAALPAAGVDRDIDAPPILFTPQTLQVSFRECAQCPEMITVPGGAMIYSDRTELIAPIAVGRFEVTFAQWDACVAAGGCGGYRPVDQGWGRGNRPVINVSWNDAQAYVQWLSQRTGQRYRLLTEAEWEYAARAGTTTNFSWGDQDPVCDQSARNGANFLACTDDRTRPVGSFQPNVFGLYDIHGNVYELTASCYDGSQSETNCSHRVIRGGSWYYGPQLLRSANRDGSTPSYRSYDRGFRVARTLN